MKILKPAFDLNCVKIEINELQESVHRGDFRSLASYQYILASIKSLGVIQPIVVAKTATGKYKILDGHIRFYALRELGQKYVYCIVSTDDERYTFDAQINGLSTFQRAGMIQKVVDSGIPLEHIADSLGVPAAKLKAELDVTRGIDKAAIDILKSANVPRAALQALRKVKPLRQIEIAERMVAEGKFTCFFVSGMVMATPPNMLVNSSFYIRSRPEDILEIASIETNSKNLIAKVKEAEEKYSTQIYELTIICGFLSKLLKNPKIDSYIQRNFSESYTRLKKISKLNNNLLNDSEV